MGGKGKVLLVDGTPIQTIIDRIKGCKNVAQNTRISKSSASRHRATTALPA